MLDKIIRLQNTIEEQELLLDNIDLLVWYLLSPDKIGLVNKKFAEFFSYKKAITKKAALKEIEKCAGSQFDPELAREFIVIQKKMSNN